MASPFVPLVDVSRHQGHIDWPALAGRGVPAVIIRAGNGDVPDDRFVENVRGARAAGLHVGAYWFANPKVHGVGEHQGNLWALTMLPHREHLTLPPMLDVENYQREPSRGFPSLSGAPFARWLHGVLDAVMAHGFRRPLIYTSASFWSAWVGSPTFGEHDLIAPRYPRMIYDQVDQLRLRDPALWTAWALATGRPPPVPAGWDRWDGWQFSAGGNHMGAWYGCDSGDLDLNIIHTDAFERWAQLPPTQPPEVPAVSTYIIQARTGAVTDPAAFLTDGLTRRWLAADAAPTAIARFGDPSPWPTVDVERMPLVGPLPDYRTPPAKVTPAAARPYIDAAGLVVPLPADTSRVLTRLRFSVEEVPAL